VVPPLPPCAEPLEDGCLLEGSGYEVWVSYGGTRYHVPGPAVFDAMGFHEVDVGTVPDAFLSAIPTAPTEGAVLREFGTGTTYAIVEGARIPVVRTSVDSLRWLTRNVTVVPPGSLDRVPTAPADGAWLKESISGQEWLVTGGARFAIPDPASRDALVAASLITRDVSLVPEGSLSGVPTVPNDGTLLRELNDETVWVTSGDFRYPIGTISTGIAEPARVEDVLVVPTGSMKQVPQALGTGVVMRDLASGQVWVVINGHRFITPDAALRQLAKDGWIAPVSKAADSAAIEKFPLLLP
jgi:hypothetical protein